MIQGSVYVIENQEPKIKFKKGFCMHAEKDKASFCLLQHQFER